MITGLDHIAIAVPDLERAIMRFMQDFGFEFEGREDVEGAATSTAFFARSATRIELIHPLNGRGPIAKYLEKRGGGLHHLCFTTDDIDADVARLKSRGYEFTTDAPYTGAHGSRVIFVHPKCSDGVLIELSQPAETAIAQRVANSHTER